MYVLAKALREYLIRMPHGYFALDLQPRVLGCFSGAQCCVGLRAQVIEFESTALMIGQLGVRVSLIAYPVVSIKKARRSLHGRQTCCALGIL